MIGFKLFGFLFHIDPWGFVSYFPSCLLLNYVVILQRWFYFRDIPQGFLWFWQLLSGSWCPCCEFRSHLTELIWRCERKCCHSASTLLSRVEVAHTPSENTILPSIISTLSSSEEDFVLPHSKFPRASFLGWSEPLQIISSLSWRTSPRFLHTSAKMDFLEFCLPGNALFQLNSPRVFRFSLFIGLFQHFKDTLLLPSGSRRFWWEVICIPCRVPLSVTHLFFSTCFWGGLFIRC